MFGYREALVVIQIGPAASLGLHVSRGDGEWIGHGLSKETLKTW